jgi:hypothetical protein
MVRGPIEAGLCSLRLYNSLVERCFCECVTEFRRRELDVAEEKVRPSVHHCTRTACWQRLFPHTPAHAMDRTVLCKLIQAANTPKGC